MRATSRTLRMLGGKLLGSVVPMLAGLTIGGLLSITAQQGLTILQQDRKIEKLDRDNAVANFKFTILQQTNAALESENAVLRHAIEIPPRRR